MKRELEREIASTLWGQEDGWRAFERTDPQVLRALQVMGRGGQVHRVGRAVATNARPRGRG